jgi:glycine dehydrogenase subunit 1
MNFIPHTEKDRQEMLKVIGVKSVDDLFVDIDKKLILKKDLNLPKSMSELELSKHMVELSEKNCEAIHNSCFLGAGSYNHFIPSVVNHIISRSEFYTAYTPYQPEVSQGTLQAIFEYQTMIANLTGMDVVNASVYDGATALAESSIMASNITKRDEIIISSTIHPEYRTVVKTYCDSCELDLKEVSFDDGITDLNNLKKMISEKTAAVFIQNPNFFGCIENISEIEKICHDKGALFIVNVVESTSLGLLKPPGDYGADIVTGEGQSFGNPMNFGGPYLGFMGTKKDYMRHIPGRLSGITKDTKGRRGFVLTLQTREQHIRRERASSNICSNEALCALATTVYLTTLGKSGLKQVANLCYQKSHYAFEEIKQIPSFKGVFSTPFYNEFVVECPVEPEKVNEELIENDIIGGFNLEKHYPKLKNCMLFCVTEMNTKKDINNLVEVLRGLK